MPIWKKYNSKYKIFYPFIPSVKKLLQWVFCVFGNFWHSTLLIYLIIPVWIYKVLFNFVNIRLFLSSRVFRIQSTSKVFIGKISMLSPSLDMLKRPATAFKISLIDKKARAIPLARAINSLLNFTTSRRQASENFSDRRRTRSCASPSCARVHANVRECTESPHTKKQTGKI